MTHLPAPFAWNYCPICGEQLVARDDGEKSRPHCSDCRRFYYRNPLPAVCCLVMREDALLLIKRGIEPCRGEWAFPGGFVEMGESTEEAIIREMEEETGLHVKSVRLIGVSSQNSTLYGPITLLGYVALDWHGEPQASSDAMEARFFLPEECPPIAFPAHAELLRQFLSGE